MDLKGRSQEILRAVIHLYIKTGSPVGSRTITQSFEFGLSPATIRNIMADLEELGFLAQPHTSAGRVPTEKGYRFYVDYFSSTDLPEYWEPPIIEESQLATKRDDLKELLQETSQLLSLLSHYMGIVVAPNLSNTIFRQLELIRLRKGHLLVILVTQDGLIHNRIIQMEDELSQEELNRIAAFLIDRFSGLDLQEVRARLLTQIQEEKDQFDRLLQRALELGQKALANEPASELYLGGASNILNHPEFSSLDRMKGLFTAFEEKAVIVKLLNKCLESEGVHVLIGSESENRFMENCSLVLANYKRGNRTLGTLGVIGPTRMEYERIIPLVGQTAKLLSRVLEEES